MQRYWLTGLLSAATLLYPLVVFFGSQFLQPRYIAAFLMILLIIRCIVSLISKHWSTPLWLAGIGFCLFALWHNQINTLRLYPVLVNALMLVVFCGSLFYPPSLIERFARLQEPALPDSAIVYTRRVTQVWCVFFLLNGSVALVTALWSSLEIWSLYNGLIAYLLMGCLFAGEYWVRLRVRRHD